MKITSPLNLNSYAKINLFLDVLLKRKDGFHNIRSIFSEIELFDELNFTLTKNGHIKILTENNFVSVQDNLIYKVAFFIKKFYSVKYGIKIELKKNIPIAAGLGGGSSNAATTIKALSQIWGLNFSLAEMHKIASKFGSDINFFLAGGSALGEGRGEKLKKLEIDEISNLFLVNPGIQIASKEAYELTDITEENMNWKSFLTKQNTNFYFNKLEEGIAKSYPLIKGIIEFLKNNGASNSILSGSGATVIGFCPDKKTALKFAKYYSKKKYWNIITKTKKGERDENYRC